MSALQLRDQLYLARANELARRGVGNVSPNPPVGAVIVARDRGIIGEGFHRVHGGPHAEIEALADARARGFAEDAIRGATMYVSLEPCNHFGRTPPCAAALVAAGVARVVLGVLDPNPRTAGGGVATLRAAGIAVEVADDPAASALIAPFARRMRTGRPFVTLKMAASINGAIAPAVGRYWLTGDAARRYVRELRAVHDAVLIGAGTARIDDPRLTIRPPRTRLRPLKRVIVGGATLPDPTAHVFAAHGPDSIVLAVPDVQFAQTCQLFAQAPNPRIEIFAVRQTTHGKIDCAALLAALAERDIFSVLCEGGPRLAASLIAEKCVDRLAWLIAPQLIATDTWQPVLAAHAGIAQLHNMRTEQLGADILIQADWE